MDEKEKRKILKEVSRFIKKAKRTRDTGTELTMKYGETSSLGKFVKTKEQADFFMKMLRAIDPNNASS